MAECMSPKQNNNQFIDSETPKTSERGLKRKNPKSTSVASKVMKKTPDYPESESPKPSTSKNCKPEAELASVTIPEEKSLCTPLASAAKDDFDETEVDFFSKFNQKLPYTYLEDEMILKFVLKGQNVFRVSSLSLWKELEVKKGHPKRTYQSLKNRFLRNIKPNLFTTYRHLIKDQETVNRLLTKFPELKKQMGIKDIFKLEVPKHNVKYPKERSRSTSDEYKRTFEKRRKSQTPVPAINVAGHSKSPSPPVQSPRTYDIERTVKLINDLIKVSVNFNKGEHSEAPSSSLMKLNERFKNLPKSDGRVFCSACGRLYRHLVTNHFLESDSESDNFIPNSVDAAKNVDKISERNASGKDDTSLKSSSNRSGSESPAFTLEKLDKSCRDSDGSSHTEGEGALEILEKEDYFPEKKARVEEKVTDNDSDIDFIYEFTVAKFKKLINADEEKSLQRAFLYRNRDLIGFNTNMVKNVDSFFLDSSPDSETPTLTDDSQTQVVVNKEADVESTQSQSTPESNLARNMMKMLTRKS